MVNGVRVDLSPSSPPPQNVAKRVYPRFRMGRARRLEEAVITVTVQTQIARRNYDRQY